MFKGSFDDKAHGYIPLIVMPVSVIATYFTTISYQLTMIVMPLVLTLIQYINEKCQRADPELFKKYGSLKRFLENSKLDWANFWKGLLIGIFLAGILIGLLSFYSFDMR